MLFCLLHYTIIGSDNNDSAVHLCGTGYHVLDVVRMTRTVYVGVVPVRRFILLVRSGNCNAALLFFRCVVDHIELNVTDIIELCCQALCNGSR